MRRPELLPIGELADRTGLAVSAVRYYDDIGLVPADDRIGGRRYYDPGAVDRVKAIAALQQAGFQLDEIARIFDLTARDRAGRRRLIEDKLADVRRRMQELERIATTLERALGCGCSSLEHCPLVLEGRG